MAAASIRDTVIERVLGLSDEENQKLALFIAKIRTEKPVFDVTNVKNCSSTPPESLGQDFVNFRR
jgi:hypothetical protein